MPMEVVLSYVPGLWIFIASAVILSFMIVFHLDRLHIAVIRGFVGLLACALVWNLFFIFEIAATEFEMKLFYAKIQYFGIAWLPTAWSRVATHVTGLPPKRWVRAVIVAIPVLTMAIIWMVPAPNWFWGDPRLVTEGVPFPIIDYDYRFWFSYILMPYEYVVVTYSFVHIVRRIGRSHRVYRRQIALIIAGAVFPYAVNGLYVLGISPIAGFNFSAAAISITGILFSWALFRYRFLDLVPVARDIVVEIMRDPVLVFDSHDRLIDFNQAAAPLLPDARKAMGMAVDDLGIDQIEQAVRTIPFVPSAPVVIATQVYDLDVQRLDTASKGFDAVIVMLHDVTEREQMAGKLREQASRDPLTGLYNRRALHERLADYGAQVSANGTGSLAVMLFDIDRFKAVNDTHGHAIGDRVLTATARAALKTARPQDIVGRFGGDEFVIIMPEINEAYVHTIARNLQHEMESIDFKGAQGVVFHVSVSIGAAVGNIDSSHVVQERFEHLLTVADSALYRAKLKVDDRFELSKALT